MERVKRGGAEKRRRTMAKEKHCRLNIDVDSEAFSKQPFVQLILSAGEMDICVRLSLAQAKSLALETHRHIYLVQRLRATRSGEKRRDMVLEFYGRKKRKKVKP